MQEKDINGTKIADILLMHTNKSTLNVSFILYREGKK